MSTARREPTVTDRVSDSPALKTGKIAGVRSRALLYRFIAGALTSVASGSLTLLFGPRVGGIFLAFPAILAASLTLIEKEEDSTDAREDARGAIVGGAALVIFAVVASLTIGHVAGALALAAATVAWLLVALLGYASLWGREGVSGAAERALGRSARRRPDRHAAGAGTSRG